MNYTQSYEYDDGDNIIQMTLPSGRIVDYTRDDVRRIEGIETTLNGLAQPIISNLQYRGDNQATQRTYGNGLNDTRTYDLQGRLTNQQLKDALDNVIDDRTYSYDKNSNVLNIDTNVEDNAYQYDKLDRITNDAIDANTPIEFTYDLNDNRLSKAFNDLTLEEFFEYVENSNRISGQESLQVGVTPLENLPARNLVYNDVGRLFQLIEEGTLKAEYLYNDEGQRTRKTIYQSDGETIDSITIYHYDQMGYLVTETTETGELIKDYLWQEGMTPVAQIDSDGANETIVYLYTDHLMTNRLATDESQNVVWRWEGEAFGNTPAQELADVSVNLRFPGQYFDSESNLHYNHFRYYDPNLGRYITSDPIGIKGGLNTYSYANVNSLTQLDILGLLGSGNVYRHGRGDYSDRRGGGSGDCMVPIWAGGYIIGWKPCDPDEECPPEGDDGEGDGDGEGEGEPEPGSGAEPNPEPVPGTPDWKRTGNEPRPWYNPEYLREKYKRPSEWELFYGSPAGQCIFRLDRSAGCFTAGAAAGAASGGNPLVGGAVGGACHGLSISACVLFGETDIEGKELRGHNT